jgi:hypothetical protein
MWKCALPDDTFTLLFLPVGYFMCISVLADPWQKVIDVALLGEPHDRKDLYNDNGRTLSRPTRASHIYKETSAYISK